MIFTALFNIIAYIFRAFNAFLPVWTPWPDFIQAYFIKLGAYSYSLDPWIEMAQFWAAVKFVLGYLLIFFGIKILSRVFRVKLLKD
jgi:hypothetical protein